MGNTNDTLTSFGWGAAASVADNILDIGFGKLRQNQQLEGQKKALQQQNDASYDLWQKTSYPAQKEMMKKAGLNPALLYGMSGAGGATLGGSSAMPDQAAHGNGMGLMMGAQMDLINAQAEQARAAANLSNTQAGKIGGVDTEVGYANLANIKQQTKNLETQNAISELEKQLKQIDVNFKDKNETEKYNQLVELGKQISITTDIMKNDKEISDKTKDAAINKAIYDAINAGLTGGQIQAQTENLQVGSNKMEAEMQQLAIGVKQKWQELLIKAFEANTGRGQLTVEQANTMIAEAMKDLQLKLRNVSDATKLTVETVEKLVEGVLQGLIFKKLLIKPETPRTVIEGFKKPY